VIPLDEKMDIISRVVIPDYIALIFHWNIE